MGGSDDIRKIKFKEVVPPVFSDLRKKPKLLVPFVISFFINLLFSITFTLFRIRLIRSGYYTTQDVIGIRVVDEIMRIAGFYYLGSILFWFISITMMVLFSGWYIISYWTYITKGDFSLGSSFKKVFRYFRKMLLASLLVGILLAIPINLPSFIFHRFIWDSLSMDGFGGYYMPNIVAMIWRLWKILLMTFFVFIHHAIIMEKKKVIDSLKRSFRVSTKNFWKVLVVRVVPSLITFPFILSGVYFFDSSGSIGTSYYLLIGLIPFIISVILYPIVTLIIIRIYVFSIMKTRRTRDKWGFKT